MHLNDTETSFFGIPCCASPTANALVNASIRTVGGLVRKSEDDILALEGLGAAGIKEIKDALKMLGLSLK